MGGWEWESKSAGGRVQRRPSPKTPTRDDERIAMEITSGGGG
jgi:hypothetical protein